MSIFLIIMLNFLRVTWLPRNIEKLRQNPAAFPEQSLFPDLSNIQEQLKSPYDEHKAFCKNVSIHSFFHKYLSTYVILSIVFRAGEKWLIRHVQVSVFLEANINW